MKTMTKLFLMIVLLGSMAMAGDMGNGGYQGCTVDCPPPPCTENCIVAPTGNTTIKSSDVIIFFVKRYLGLSF